MGSITQSLPTFFIPDVPFNFETLQIILPYSLALAVVGLVESLLTSSILDDMTATDSDKNKEARGQGIANFINGFFGGMAGCAMIGQSVINVKSGGRGRLSTLVSGVFLMFLILVLGDYVVQIPMPVLAGVMVVVCITQFDWSSFKYMVTAPKKDVFVMLITVAIVLYTHNLAIGVVAGVLVSAMFFVGEISRVNIRQENQVFYITGQLFFASTEGFLNYFKNVSVQDTNITLDFSDSHVWDDSAVGALLKVQQILANNGNTIHFLGLNATNEKLVQKITGMT